MIRTPWNNIAEPVKRIGLIADTHGLMRPEALAALGGVDLVLHAGDIGKPEVLQALKAVAPVIAIKGNNDSGAWAKPLPEARLVKAGGLRLYMIHNVKELDFDPAARKIDVVISGHSHNPSVATRGGVLFINPGSAGPRRFKLPVAVGILRAAGVKAAAKIVALDL